MSITLKIGGPALSCMVMAYLLGIRLCDENASADFRTLAAIAGMGFCLWVFMRNLFSLYRTLHKLTLRDGKHTGLRDETDSLLIP